MVCRSVLNMTNTSNDTKEILYFLQHPFLVAPNPSREIKLSGVYYENIARFPLTVYLFNHIYVSVINSRL